MKKYTLVALAFLLLMFFMPLFELIEATNIGALASAAVSLFTSPTNAEDLYDYGECTYWAALRRIEIGQPVPNTWGNAITWAQRAAADGYQVDHTPAYGAIMQDPNAPGGLGHVAFVESVDSINGSWTISEMNRVGWDEVDYRTLTAADALDYNFIH